MTLYSEEVQARLHSYTWPRALIVDVVEYKDHLGLRLYRDNFETFDGVEKEFIAKQINGAITEIRKMGCPIYLEVEKGNGKLQEGQSHA